MAMQFAAAISSLKQAHDRNAGVELSADDVAGLIWGIKLLRKGPQDAADDPA